MKPWRVVEQRSHTFSVKYFRLSGRTVSVTTLLCPCSTKSATDEPQTSGRVCAPIQHFLWALKFGSHIIFMCFLVSFQPFKNVKTILSLQAGQKQVAGQVWLTGCNLKTSLPPMGLHRQSWRRISRTRALVPLEPLTLLGPQANHFCPEPRLRHHWSEGLERCSHVTFFPLRKALRFLRREE